VNNAWSGIYTSGASGVIANCLARGNGDRGITVESAHNVTVRNCTSSGNTTHGIVVWYWENLTLLNNILHADGAGRRTTYIYGYNPALSDYNDFYALGGAIVGELHGQAQSTLSDWRTATGQDSHSLSVNPLFVNPGGSDFHVRSTAGSYHGGRSLPTPATATSSSSTPG
jgi:parallel beta-helix repeat protein